MNASVPVSVALMLVLAPQAFAQDAKTKYPSMAPLEQYLMDPTAEIALARSAAPESISGTAEVLVLTRHGYETAAKGTNGFVCMVQRSWSAPIGDPEFWNSKGRAPICFNAAAARSQVTSTVKRTELVLAGRSEVEISQDLKAAIDKKQLPEPEPGSMCYMMSKQAYLSDSDPHWHPHLMFFTPLTDPGAWGADLPGSPIFAFKNTGEHSTVFLVPITRWSDGTPASPEAH